MGVNENVLEHIAEPADPSERASATSVALEDWEALRLARALEEHGHYEVSGEESDIALGAATYLQERVREHGFRDVRLYVHTDTAARVVAEAAEAVEPLDGAVTVDVAA